MKQFSRKSFVGFMSIFITSSFHGNRKMNQFYNMGKVKIMVVKENCKLSVVSYVYDAVNMSVIDIRYRVGTSTTMKVREGFVFVMLETKMGIHHLLHYAYVGPNMPSVIHLTAKFH